MFRLKNPSPALHTVSLHLSGTTIRSMTAKNLNKIFQPANVTVIGASPRKGSVGNTVMGNPTSGAFAGKIFLVNPSHKEIAGLSFNFGMLKNNRFTSQ
jgi:hypothetical protein